MSILTGHISAKEGVLVSDTLAVSNVLDLAEPLHVSKAFTIPHLGMVFGTRGSVAFPAWFLVGLNNRRLDDFDAVTAALPEIARGAYIAAASTMQAHDAPMIVQGVVMGWSKARNRAVGIMFANCADGVSFLSDEAQDFNPDFHTIAIPDGVFALPGPDAADQAHIMARRKMDVRERMIACARAQRDAVERQLGVGQSGIGGRLIMFNVGKFAVECRTIYSWPEDLIRPTEDTAPNVVRLGLSRVAA